MQLRCLLSGMPEQSRHSAVRCRDWIDLVATVELIKVGLFGQIVASDLRKLVISPFFIVGEWIFTMKITFL